MSFPKIDKDQREKAKRKPLPKTRRAWMAELEGVEKFILKKPRNLDDNGRRWYESISRYYLARLMYLVTHPPANLPRVAARAIVKQLVRSL